MKNRRLIDACMMKRAGEAEPGPSSQTDTLNPFGEVFVISSILRINENGSIRFAQLVSVKLVVQINDHGAPAGLFHPP